MKNNNQNTKGLIPKHWQLKKLGEVCNVLDNLRKPINSTERQKRILGKRENDLYPYFGATGQVGWIDDYLTDGEFILIGEDGAPFLDIFKNKAYKIKGKTWVNNHAHILKGKEQFLIDDFALYYLNSINYREFVNGTTRLKLTKSNLVEIPFVLPPLLEQQDIVAKIEELLSELENGKKQLQTAKKQLKVYRQSLLKAAFEGKLTNENINEGIKELKNEKIKNGELPKGDALSLPKGWKWIKFIDFCKLQRGYDLPLNNIIKGKYPVVTSSGIKGYHNEFRSNGPCLITGRSGGVGNIHFIKVEKYWPHNTALFVKDFCNNIPEFVYYFFMQFNFKSFGASTTIPTLDRKQLYNELVKLPPIEEQQLIVSELESKLTVCDKIEETISQSLQQAEALRQSILKKAFEGELIKE